MLRLVPLNTLQMLAIGVIILVTSFEVLFFLLSLTVQTNVQTSQCLSRRSTCMVARLIGFLTNGILKYDDDGVLLLDNVSLRCRRRPLSRSHV